MPQDNQITQTFYTQQWHVYGGNIISLIRQLQIDNNII
jgi:hypothetical protein